MSADNLRRILMIAGDYDLVQHVRRMLPAGRFAVQNAYSHLDAIHMLGQEDYDAIIVDAAMTDRHTGEQTIATVAEARSEVPLLALALDETSAQRAEKLAERVFTSLDGDNVLHGVLQALGLPLPRDTRTKPIGDDLSRQVDEISTLFALSKSLAEVLDLTELLNRVVEAARDLTNAEEGMILLPEGEELYLRARVGIDIEAARSFRVKTQDTLAGQVFKTGKPTLVGASGPQKVKTEYFVNSLLYVPIILHGKIIGVLGINNRQKEDLFTERHQELLSNLASFAAIAIENARIHEESLERARELESLVAASQVVNASLSLDQVLPNISKQLATVVDVGYAEIYDWKREANKLATMARYYQAAWPFGRGPVAELSSHTALATVLERDRHTWVSRDDKRHPAEAGFLEKMGAEAMMIVPLCVEGQVLGALRTFYIEMPQVPSSAATVQRIRTTVLEALVDLLQRTDRIMSDRLLKLGADVNRTVGSDWCELLIPGNAPHTLVLLARLGSGLWHERPAPTIDLSGYPELTQSLEQGSLVATQMSTGDISAGNFRGMRVLMERSQSRSVLGIPLIQRGKTQGLVVFADTERTREFSAREIDMAKAIVGQASTALENANLLLDLEKSLQELKDAQDRLVQTARLSAMGELAAVVAHQINNPLTTIIVDTELMLMDETEDSPRYQSLQAIDRAGKRAANVARRLLAIARPTQPETESDPVDVLDTVRGILSLVQTHVERDDIRIVADLPEQSMPPVMAVKGRLDDIWLNLIMNAHDALVGREDARIDVRVRYVPDEEQIQVEVSDNGPGIPDHIKRQIFSPFFTTKPVGEGTGLGLHVCREVVENVGGSIDVDSVVGKYTRFVVCLPAAVSRVTDEP